MKYIVELEPGTCWMAPWSGDPGRTCVKTSAKKYESRFVASLALAYARRFRPFTEAKITGATKLDQLRAVKRWTVGKALFYSIQILYEGNERMHLSFPHMRVPRMKRIAGRVVAALNEAGVTLPKGRGR